MNRRDPNKEPWLPGQTQPWSPEEETGDEQMPCQQAAVWKPADGAEEPDRADESDKAAKADPTPDPDAAGEKDGKQMIRTGSVVPVKGKYPIHCLTIIGQIEGHYSAQTDVKTTKYEHIIPQLVAIEQDPEILGLLVILNTVGGDVEAGLALAELIAGMKKPTVSLVLGGGHSIGVPLAVSTKYSLIAPSATMTIHPVRVNGLVLGVPQTLNNFAQMQDRITRFVVKNSKISAETFTKLMMNNDQLVMDMGTVLDGESAVKTGLIDRTGGLCDALDALNSQIAAMPSRQLHAGKTGANKADGKKQQKKQLPDGAADSQ